MSRPRTWAVTVCEVGYAEPIWTLSRSPVASPTLTPWRRRTNWWMAASMSNPPTRTADPATTPPIATRPISVIPPPTSTTRLPTGSWTGRPAPTAAAMGFSIKVIDRAPALDSASSTARRSTAVRPEGTQARAFGRARRPAPIERNTARRNCSARS